MKCGKCGAYISNGFSVCTSCNTPVSELEMKNMLIKENKEEEVVNMPEEKLNDELTSNENTNANQFNANTNDQTIIDVASELPIIEDTPAVENIQETAPVTEIEPVTVIEPTPVVEPIQEVTIAPTIEPTPVVETMPEVNVTPEPVSVAEEMPVVDSPVSVEPTPVVENTVVEPTVTTTMEETKPFVEENTVINSVTNNTVEPTITTTEPTTAETNTQTEETPKKKSALPFVILGIVAVIAVVVVVILLVVLPKTKPSYAFEQMIKGVKSGIVESLEKTEPVKYDVTLTPNIVVTGNNAEQQTALASVINKFSFTSSVYTNSTTNELHFNLNSKYNNKELITLDYIEKDKKTYTKAAPFLAKYLASEVEEETIEVKNEDIIAVLNGIEKAYLASAQDSYFKKADAKLKVNGEEVAVKANTLDLNKENFAQFVKDAAKILSEDTEFVKGLTPILNLYMQSQSEDDEMSMDEMPEEPVALTETDVKNKLKAIAEGKDTTLKLNPVQFTVFLKGKDPQGFELVTEQSNVRVVLEENMTTIYTSVIKDGKKTDELTELAKVKTEGEKTTVTLTVDENGVKTVATLNLTVKETKNYKVQLPTEEQIYTEEESFGVLMGLVGGLMTGDLTQIISASEGAVELMNEPVVKLLVDELTGDLMNQMGPGNVMGEANTTTPEVEETLPEEPTVSEPVVQEPIQDVTTETNTSTISE